MLIGIGSDHGGYELKEMIIDYLRNKKIDVDDCGCFNLESCDYPIYAKKVALGICEKRYDLGILICTTGIGMSICANKFSGVRAALVLNEDMCSLTRRHNNSNVLCLAAKYTSFDQAKNYIDIFLNTDFEGGRHSRRVEMIEKK